MMIFGWTKRKWIKKFIRDVHSLIENKREWKGNSHLIYVMSTQISFFSENIEILDNQKTEKKIVIGHPIFGSSL